MRDLEPPGHRSRQRDQQRKLRTRIGALVVVASLLVVALGVWGALRRDDDGDTAAAGSGPSSSTLLALAVQGPHALGAVVGAEGPDAPAVVAVPGETVFVVPGQGEAMMTDAASLPGGAFRIGMANLLGTWVDHFAVLDRDTLGAVVDRIGGIEVNLGEPFEASTGTIGPGPVTMDGAQVREYLATEDDTLDLRWQLVLQGLFAQEIPLLPSDLVESDDEVAVAGLLNASRGAGVRSLPVEEVQTLTTPDQPAVAELTAQAFGRDGPQPINVIVTNGSGRPGVGQEVAGRIIPAGFRVVISDNAERFGRERTQIVANGDSAIPIADRVREAMGVGEVVVSQIPSGLAEVTILVGEDLSKTEDDASTDPAA
ncbi:MAG: LCP family protein [Actinomycetota bacterium]